MFGFYGGRRPDLGPPPPPFSIEGESGGRGLGTRGWLVILGLLLLLYLGLNIAKDIYSEWLWFDSLEFTSVYSTIITTKVALFAVSALVFLLFLMLNVVLARRMAPGISPGVIPEEELVFAHRMTNLAIVVGGLFLAVIFGSLAANEWGTILRFLNQESFGSQDPFFGQDLGFYVFTLPFFRSLQVWAMEAVVVILVVVTVVYGFSFSLQRLATTLSTSIKGHLSILGVILFLLFAWGYWMDTFDLLYSAQGAAYGASYSDINATLPALRILTAVAVVSAFLLLINIFLRGVGLPLVGISLWVAVALVGLNIYPQFVQRLLVQPNELERERPYIVNNIRMTREAYGLDRIDESDFPAEDIPKLEEIKGNPETIENVRLWDHQPLKDTYNQIQTIRLYYDFNDVDVDRYTIEGKYRQVMLSARELAPEKLAAQAQTWVNQRLQFTHGYGAAVSPVNEFTREGLPNFLVKDVPPSGTFKIERPEIYYGEKTTNYVIVNTDVEEFDYPKGDENVFTTYAGESGVVLSSRLRKVVYAWQLGDPNILLSGQLPAQSRLLYYRQIQERVRHIAPFLMLDRDPYLVILDGRLVWVQDAYTITNKYPYSEPYRGTFNYIRNSVKIVIDAYEGNATFYISEPNDPIIRTYAKIFPSLFTPLEKAPIALRAHFRYPEDMFNVQSTMYQTYQMRDPRVFYNKEDYLNRPQEIYLDAKQATPMNAYYLIMKLPGEAKPEFLILLPFTPANRDNTIAWLAARSDGEFYGKLKAFKFPKDKLVYGPMQINARISQDEVISQQFTLWDQAGSQVLRGNLLMIPIGQSNLYVQPIYLQAERGKIPELKRVIVAAGNRIAMEPSLEESLAKIYGPSGPSPAASPTPTTPGAAPPGPAATIGELARSAQEHFNKAQEHLKSGNWAGYGAEIKAMEEAISRLVELAGR